MYKVEPFDSVRDFTTLKSLETISSLLERLCRSQPPSFEASEPMAKLFELRSVISVHSEALEHEQYYDRVTLAAGCLNNTRELGLPGGKELVELAAVEPNPTTLRTGVQDDAAVHAAVDA